jgi:hypothetical protein
VLKVGHLLNDLRNSSHWGATNQPKIIKSSFLSKHENNDSGVPFFFGTTHLDPFGTTIFSQFVVSPMESN